jgi:hypothetical protein
MLGSASNGALLMKQTGNRSVCFFRRYIRDVALGRRQRSPHDGARRLTGSAQFLGVLQVAGARFSINTSS